MPFLLTIRERNDSWAGRGPSVSTYPTRGEAEAALLDYVLHNWEGEVGTDQPNDPEDMVREYFDAVFEAYDIVET